MRSNTIGIDFGRTATVAYLCDGVWPACRWRCIGDGQRARIPNAVDGAGRWASAAVAAGAPDLNAGYANLTDEPWLDSKAAYGFWENLGRRLTAFLGRVEPVPESGYRVVIALHTVDFATTAQSMQALCCRDAIASFDGAVCVPAHRAVLCRWMPESPDNEARRLTAVIVCVGDTLTSVSAYEIERCEEGLPRVVRCGAPIALDATRAMEKPAIPWPG
jgi:hypothetical protein